MKKAFVFLATATLVSGCSMLGPGIASRPLPRPNPTQYDFRAPLPSVRECIRGLFGGSKGEMDLELSENLVVLDSKGRSLGLSPVYTRDGASLPISGRFHISMTSLPGGTRVELHALEISALLDGGERRISLAPTTIEEYRILLRIGDCLGEKGMPLIVLPDSK